MLKKMLSILTVEDIGDEEALKIVDAERKAAMDEYVKELEAEGLTPDDVA